ncbi:SIS domain-containing protein, partial [Salmonella enterica subsp. enterica serovar Anatum]|nr:SIS domain-containing protein [Salmonella enterica subsp. enterica serovar Anatum]
IHAEAYAAGELKHGPLALIDADMPVIVVAPNNELLEKLKSNMGTTITNGTVKDTNNVIWRLPDSVVIGVDGTVTATAICSKSGA